MRIAEEKENVVDPRGGEIDVFVKYYYCETCGSLVFLENVEIVRDSMDRDKNLSLV